MLFIILIILLSSCTSKEQLTQEILDKKERFVSTLSIEPSGNIALGQIINFKFITENRDVEDRTFYLLGNKKAIFQVFDQKSRLLWSNSPDITSDLQKYVFPALSSKEVLEQWNGIKLDGDNVEIGRYKVKAYIPVAENMKGFTDSLFFNFVD